MQSLNVDQQRQATITPGKKTANNAHTQAFRDNVQMPYAGIKASALNEKQREALVNLIAEYVDNLADGHAKIRMTEVRAHLATRTSAGSARPPPTACSITAFTVRRS